MSIPCSSILYYQRLILKRRFGQNLDGHLRQRGLRNGARPQGLFFFVVKINNAADVAELGMNGIGNGLGDLSQIKRLGDEIGDFLQSAQIFVAQSDLGIGDAQILN